MVADWECASARMTVVAWQKSVRVRHITTPMMAAGRCTASRRGCVAWIARALISLPHQMRVSETDESKRALVDIRTGVPDSEQNNHQLALLPIDRGILDLCRNARHLFAVSLSALSQCSYHLLSLLFLPVSTARVSIVADQRSSHYDSADAAGGRLATVESGHTRRLCGTCRVHYYKKLNG